MAQKPEDILSRRFRLTFLDSAVSQTVTEKVKEIMEQEQKTFSEIITVDA
jgi:glycerol-3-phosphate dehydrogenase